MLALTFLGIMIGGCGSSNSQESPGILTRGAVKSAAIACAEYYQAVEVALNSYNYEEADLAEVALVHALIGANQVAALDASDNSELHNSHAIRAGLLSEIDSLSLEQQDDIINFECETWQLAYANL